MPKLGISTSPQFGEHNLGFRHTTTLDFGRLQVACLKDCVPNDKISLNLHSLVTCAPNPSPINGKMVMDYRAFFVPNRILWDTQGAGWNEYITGLAQGLKIPTLDSQKLDDFGHTMQPGEASAEIRDMRGYWSSFGLPLWRMDIVNSFNTEGVSVLPLRAYRKIWWDWYRDSQIIPDDEESNYIESGSTVNYNLYGKPLYRCYGKNYYTNCLTAPSLDTDTTYPDSSSLRGALADANGSRSLGEVNVGNTLTSVYGGGTLTPTSSINGGVADGLGTNVLAQSTQQNRYPVSIDQNINDLRYANSLQRWIEKCNILGGRLMDRLKGMFGASTTAAALQMSEYIGGSSFDVNFTTSSSSASTESSGAQYNAFGRTDTNTGSMKGQLTGNGSGSGDMLNINYHVKEHGFFIVLMSVMPDPVYYTGIDRLWKRGITTINKDRFDFLTPEMVNNGFDAITYDEVVTLPAGLDEGNYTPNTIFGYAERYADYKYSHDLLSGDFMTSFAPSMDSWVLGRNLWRESGCVDSTGSAVSGKTGTDLLNAINRQTITGFDSSDASLFDEKFTISNSTMDHFVVDMKIDLKMVRPLPSISFPTIETATSVTSANVGGTRF